ncbi:MAG: hypothetical protein IJ735_03550 [Clostridia bacterium]|nr:hypothetical protein [Clostridia bacterium]
MRETIIRGTDNGFRYSLGAGVEILIAARELPGTIYTNYLCTENHISGAQLLDFVKRFGDLFEDVFDKIDQNDEYRLFSFDD